MTPTTLTFPRWAGRLAKLTAAGVLAAMAPTAAAEDYHFKVKNECSVPLTLYVHAELVPEGWTTVGPIQIGAGERKYLSRGGREVTSDNSIFLLFAHVQGNPDVVVLRGQRDDPDDRNYDIFGRTRRFERMRDEFSLFVETDVWIDCEQMVFDGVSQRARPARNSVARQMPKPVKVKLPPRRTSRTAR